MIELVPRNCPSCDCVWCETPEVAGNACPFCGAGLDAVDADPEGSDDGR